MCESSKDPVLIRGWDIVIEDIPPIWTFYRRIGLLASNYRLSFVGYDAFNGHYTVYLDPGNECSYITVTRDETRQTISKELIGAEADSCDACVDGGYTQTCPWPVRMLAGPNDIGLFDISDPFTDYCGAPPEGQSLYQRPWLFGVSFDDDPCTDQVIQIPYGPGGYPNVGSGEISCYDCPDTTPSGIITFSRRTIYV